MNTINQGSIVSKLFNNLEAIAICFSLVVAIFSCIFSYQNQWSLNNVTVKQQGEKIKRLEAELAQLKSTLVSSEDAREQFTLIRAELADIKNDVDRLESPYFNK